MRAVLIATALILGASHASADDSLPTLGGTLALSCAACHGTDGASPGNIPALRGRSATFIRKQLQAFQSGRRPSTVMGRIAKGYTKDEIELIAKHFASIEPEANQ